MVLYVHDKVHYSDRIEAKIAGDLGVRRNLGACGDARRQNGNDFSLDIVSLIWQADTAQSVQAFSQLPSLPPIPRKSKSPADNSRGPGLSSTKCAASCRPSFDTALGQPASLPVP